MSMTPRLFVIPLLLYFAAHAGAQSPAERDLYESLKTNEKAEAALKTVLDDADRFSPLILFTSSAVALRSEQLEDAAYLFYCAKLRTQFDRASFPPQEKGSESPFVLYSAFSQQLGYQVNPAIMAQPQLFSSAIKRLIAWAPLNDENYDPGYRYSERVSYEEAEDNIAKDRETYRSALQDLSLLLDDETYFKAFREYQKINSKITLDLGSDAGNKQTSDDDEQRNMALATMKRIEKKLGLQGFASQSAKPK